MGNSRRNGKKLVIERSRPRWKSFENTTRRRLDLCRAVIFFLSLTFPCVRVCVCLCVVCLWYVGEENNNMDQQKKKSKVEMMHSLLSS